MQLSGSVDREALVLGTIPLVGRVARSLLGRLPAQVELGDLTQAGVLGLLDAAQKFDSCRGVRFTTYAELRIRGAILDSLRGLDWVPRSVRRERRELEAAQRLLESSLGRTPSETEIASQLGCTLTELRKRRERARAAELASEGGDFLDPVVPLLADPAAADPHEVLERLELESIVAAAVEELPERERLVVTLYYYEELTMKEVGQVLGVNESRVSQIHSKAIATLRAHCRAACLVP